MALQSVAQSLGSDDVFELSWQATFRFGTAGPPADEEGSRAAMLQALKDAGWETLSKQLEDALKTAVQGDLAAFSLTLPLVAAFWDAVPEELTKGYFQVEDVERTEPALRLQRPPTPKDIARVKEGVADKGSLMQLVQDWLFGAGRRPAITSTRGELPPLTAIVPTFHIEEQE